MPHERNQESKNEGRKEERKKERKEKKENEQDCEDFVGRGPELQRSSAELRSRAVMLPRAPL